jgi:hypothetical protein
MLQLPYLLTACCVQLHEEIHRQTIRSHAVSALQYYAFVEEKQKVHCLNTLFSKVRPLVFGGFCSGQWCHISLRRASSKKGDWPLLMTDTCV